MNRYLVLLSLSVLVALCSSAKVKTEKLKTLKYLEDSNDNQRYFPDDDEPDYEDYEAEDNKYFGRSRYSPRKSQSYNRRTGGSSKRYEEDSSLPRCSIDTFVNQASIYKPHLCGAESRKISAPFCKHPNTAISVDDADCVEQPHCKDNFVDACFKSTTCETLMVNGGKVYFCSKTLEYTDEVLAQLTADTDSYLVDMNTLFCSKDGKDYLFEGQTAVENTKLQTYFSSKYKACTYDSASQKNPFQCVSDSFANKGITFCRLPNTDFTDIWASRCEEKYSNFDDSYIATCLTTPGCYSILVKSLDNDVTKTYFCGTYQEDSALLKPSDDSFIISMNNKFCPPL